MISLIQQNLLISAIVGAVLCAVCWWRHRRWLAIATVVLVFAAWADRPSWHSNETKSLAFGLFVSVLTLWAALGAFWLFEYLTNRWEATAATERKARVIQDLLYRVVNWTNQYRRHRRLLGLVICALLLITVFTFSSWLQWWADVPNNSGRDPTSFFLLYIAALIAQVVGVLVTVFLYKVIKEGRVETPVDMFKVFQEALLEAHKGGKTVLHHIAPFPGLFELLHESLDFEAGAKHNVLKSTGEWKRYVKRFWHLPRPTNGADPLLTLAMVKYWQERDGRRVYKGSPLYYFAVEVFRTSSTHDALTRLAKSKRQGDGATEDGRIRFWYHTMIFELLTVIDNSVREHKIKLWYRSPNWTETTTRTGWEDELGFTLVATSEEAYLGLPRMKGTEFRFQGRRVDFQHEAVSKLETLVRTDASAGWVEMNPTGLSAVEFGEISPASES